MKEGTSRGQGGRGALPADPTVPIRACAEPGVEVSHGSGDVPTSYIQQSYPMVQYFPSHCGDQTQAIGGDAGRMQPLPPPRCTSLLLNRHVCRDSTPQHANQTKAPTTSRQAGLAPSAEFRRSCSDPHASYQPRDKGPVAEPQGPGKRPQAASEDSFPKARLKRIAHFICLFIYLLLSGKCNTKANYLIKALGRVLMSQTSKQISKPLFCVQLQSRGRDVGAGWGDTGPLSRAAAARPAMAQGGSAWGQARRASTAAAQGCCPFFLPPGGTPVIPGAGASKKRVGRRQARGSAAEPQT